MKNKLGDFYSRFEIAVKPRKTEILEFIAPLEVMNQYNIVFNFATHVNIDKPNHYVAMVVIPYKDRDVSSIIHTDIVLDFD